MEAEAIIAHNLHDALTATGARGSVRVHEGRWFVRLMRGQSRQGFAFPPGGQDREEWLAAMLDRLEAASGVRPVLEVDTKD
jgi:hypothetical protein